MFFCSPEEEFRIQMDSGCWDIAQSIYRDMWWILEPKCGPLFGLEKTSFWRVPGHNDISYNFFSFFGSKKAGLFDSSLGRTFSLRCFFRHGIGVPIRRIRVHLCSHSVQCRASRKPAARKQVAFSWKCYQTRLLGNCWWCERCSLLQFHGLTSWTFRTFFLWHPMPIFVYRHPTISKLRWPVFLFLFFFFWRGCKKYRFTMYWDVQGITRYTKSVCFVFFLSGRFFFSK